MNRFHLSLALGAALLSSVASAQAPGGWQQKDQTRAEAHQRADRLFQMIDINKDGTVTRGEADQALAQFTEMRGGDDDGASRGAGRMQRMIDQAFAGAPAMTLQQYDAQVLARFDAADLNHDGILTSAERAQARAAMRAQAAPATPQ